MTIKNFTFFSPNGTEFPVGSNNDGKLYMMLTGMDYGTIRRKDWSNPINTALNVQYSNTSIVAGGRYFELINETIALQANTVNYIHANIDLTKTANPVSLSSETANNSNNIDINNSSGVLKVCFETVETSASSVTSVNHISQKTSIEDLNVSGKISDLGMSNFTPRTTTWSSNGISISFTRVGPLVTGVWGGTQSNVAQGFTYTKSIPSGYRPIENSSFVVMQIKPSNFNIYTSGLVRYWATPDVSGGLNGAFTYFTNDPFPA